MLRVHFLIFSGRTSAWFGDYNLFVGLIRESILQIGVDAEVLSGLNPSFIHVLWLTRGREAVGFTAEVTSTQFQPNPISQHLLLSLPRIRCPVNRFTPSDSFKKLRISHKL
ncbi:hypothetical protein Oscil6304_3043 [Oscillatoria acuminata PCC 6304]|uniref:Uncharacterized protein n=1 Tax=Oscillatoria acuminata PCC 6304 TaxID=56110 RepID=K9TJQ4_9CYAN|nr:hypothetical protein Oscil6304_3043 [Oscillatoria acuminata PCC 6304]